MIARIIERQKHYGKNVAVSTYAESIRREHCLCLHCRNSGTCITAKELYALCQNKDMAMCITRCLNYQEQS